MVISTTGGLSYSGRSATERPECTRGATSVITRTIHGEAKAQTPNPPRLTIWLDQTTQSAHQLVSVAVGDDCCLRGDGSDG